MRVTVFSTIPRALEPGMRKNECDQPCTGVLTLDVSPAMLTLRYPERCTGAAFDAAYADAGRAIRAHQANFGLVHDLRHVRVTSLDGRAVLDDASDIAAAGRVRCVAFIISGGVLWRRSFAFAIRSLSPVQPARVFTDIESARLWVTTTACRSRTDRSRRQCDRAAQPAECRELNLYVLWS